MDDTPLPLPRDAGLRRIFESGEYSDLVLYCTDSISFNVHKNILCVQSKYFENACKPGRFKEGKEGRIDLAYDSTTTAALLEYMYTQDYDGTKTTFSSPEDALLEHAKIYVAAEFLNVPQLKQTATRKFKETCKDIVYGPAPQFLQAIKLIYTETLVTDALFRNAIVEQVVAGCRSSFEGLDALMGDVSELGKDCAIGLFAELEKQREIVENRPVMKCPKCSHMWLERIQGKSCPIARCAGVGILI